MVIDELIVVLGLDATKFTEGQRTALEAFRKTQDSAESFGKNLEAQGAKLSQMFGVVRNGALGIMGAFVGGEVAGFINNVINMDASTGRFAKTIGTTVENLGLWKVMMGQVGGNAEDATGALNAMQSALNNLRFGSGTLPAPVAFLLGKIPGAMQSNNADDVFRKIGEYLRGEIAGGRMTTDQASTQLSWLPGMNQSMIFTLLGDFKKIEEAAKKIGGASKESADQAIQLQQSSNALKSSLDNLARITFPALTSVVDTASKIFEQDIKDVKAFMNYFGLGGAKASTGPAATPSAVASGGAPGQRASAGEREGWIKSIAEGLGIDPQIALRVSKSEGFNNYRSSIPGEQSFGDFQLNMIKGNLGDVFQKQTGLDPRDPANEKSMDEFALKWVSTHGWGAFHGAKNTGISQWEGIGARSSAGSRSTTNRSSSSSNSASTTNINKVEVVTQATDAAGIAADIAPAIKYASMTAPANSGLS